MNNEKFECKRPRRIAWRAAAISAALALAACGGGSGEGGLDGSVAGGGGGQSAPQTERSTPLSAAAAARFLTQATYGPTSAEIARLTTMTYGAWLEDQFAKPQLLHRLTMNQVAADNAATGNGSISKTDFYNSFWSQAIAGDDQLRQRAAFALSQIFVISVYDPTVVGQPRGVASYYDMLGEKAFGNFRDLLEGVSLHPMMGIYLTWMKNQKEDPSIGRVPDQNYAREVTQLFTIGQWKLRLDGTIETDGSGQPIPAYGITDIEGFSRVLTGYSWYAGSNPSDRTGARFISVRPPTAESDWRPMQAYNGYAPNTDYHSLSEKLFLGKTILASTTSDPESDLKAMLDALFHHPNVGPFIGKQLIQRLVTSNPSPAYVARVAAAFNDNGSGVRGDMKAVWKAILLDPEARNPGPSASYGKLREPVVRFANFLRAFNAKSDSGLYAIGATDDAASQLNQAPLSAPSVFNFYNPGYVPSSQSITDAHLVAPELQITHDVSVAGYMRFMQGKVKLNASNDVKQDYSAELALAESPDTLLDRINLLLFSGQMPEALRSKIGTAVSSVTIPLPKTKTAVGADGVERDTGEISNQKAIDDARLNRVYIAVYLSMVSPDYLIQR